MHTFRPLLIATLVVSEVALWQWRMVIAHRGRRAGAMLLGFVGAVLQITAISQVVANVHDVLSIAAYAGGVGFGVLFGLMAGDRLTPGPLGITIVTAVPELADELWQRGWPLTVHTGHDRHGPVLTLSVEVERREAPRLREHTEHFDPAARWVAKELHAQRSARSQTKKSATRGHTPATS